MGGRAGAKPMKIKTLIEKITPLLPLFACDNATEDTPYRYSILTAEAKGFADVTAVAWKHGKQKNDPESLVRAAYLVHCANHFPKLLEALESDLRIFKAAVYDTNPHNDLNRGDSIDYDAACLNVERVENALTQAREVKG